GTRVLAAAGLAGCLVLAATLPPVGALTGAAALAAGLAGRAALRAARPGG
ncbi:MAG: hypothetical protein AVDCRST_MAG41-2102, partial [uncultured Corynebacteriales bacterium]